MLHPRPMATEGIRMYVLPAGSQGEGGCGGATEQWQKEGLNSATQEICLCLSESCAYCSRNLEHATEPLITYLFKLLWFPLNEVKKKTWRAEEIQSSDKGVQVCVRRKVIPSSVEWNWKRFNRKIMHHFSVLWHFFFFFMIAVLNIPWGICLLGL